MARVVIAGATGVVGSHALEELVRRADVEQVIALGRRLLSAAHPKLVSKVANFQSAGAMAAELPQGVAAALCALGTTMKQAGSKEAFRKVDHDAVVAFAKAAKERGAKRFVLVSSIGASAKAASFYLRTKGETEDALAALGFEQVTFLRPSLLDDEGTRPDQRAGERLTLPVMRAVFKVVGKTSRYAPITATTVGRALVRLAFDETKERVRTIEGAALHRAGA